MFLRNVNPEKGFWSLPGGSVEFGKSVEDAVVREFYEELGVQVDVIALLSVATHIINDIDSHWISPEFLVKIFSGTPKNIETDIHTEMKWFSLDNLTSRLAMPEIVAIEG